MLICNSQEEPETPSCRRDPCTNDKARQEMHNTHTHVTLGATGTGEDPRRKQAGPGTARLHEWVKEGHAGGTPGRSRASRAKLKGHQ